MTRVRAMQTRCRIPSESGCGQTWPKSIRPSSRARASCDVRSRRPTRLAGASRRRRCPILSAGESCCLSGTPRRYPLSGLNNAVPAVPAGHSTRLCRLGTRVLCPHRLNENRGWGRCRYSAHPCNTAACITSSARLQACFCMRASRGQTCLKLPDPAWVCGVKRMIADSEGVKYVRSTPYGATES